MKKSNATELSIYGPKREARETALDLIAWALRGSYRGPDPETALNRRYEHAEELIAAIEAEASSRVLEGENPSASVDADGAAEPAAAEPPDRVRALIAVERVIEKHDCRDPDLGIPCAFHVEVRDAIVAEFDGSWNEVAVRAAQPPRGSLPDQLARFVRPDGALIIDEEHHWPTGKPPGASLTATEPPLYCDHGRPIGPPCSECAAGSPRGVTPALDAPCKHCGSAQHIQEYARLGSPEDSEPSASDQEAEA